ncbi:reverse transcriptase domain-containing protein [Paraburkholderia sp. EG285A]|uniref:reverse transcriptase domain-containing protein n=1 Tax=Paraburkholderia sp. EG285A TaxID=3237009 RepID=UPI0034D37387
MLASHAARIHRGTYRDVQLGFRPGKSARNALDAVSVGVERRKVNWILDADISKFYGTIGHDWLVKFLEHRVADTRVVRLIKKWLHAGVLEEGRLTHSEVGTVQGGSISPLLSNIYLHYAFDLWVKQWRARYAEGDVIVVRYADDRVAGFQQLRDAKRFRHEMTERLVHFGLKLHESKTRLMDFGRFARENCRRLDGSKPPTFDFLGFTHCCGNTRKGKFAVLRLTSARRMRVKLLAVKDQLRRRMHQSVAEQGRYVRAVVARHIRYFGVPRNGRRIGRFRHQIVGSWYRTCRRSQIHRVKWARIQRPSQHWLPLAQICHPYPTQRLIVTTHGSRMR